MAKDPEHAVEMHRLATARRNAGRPTWDETIDLSAFFRDESLSFAERRDRTVAAVKASRWWKREGDEPALSDVIDGLEQSEDADEFDLWWDDLYDLADYARVWIKL